MKSMALALALLLTACSAGDPETYWTPAERVAIADAEADICSAFPEWCGAYTIQDLRRITGPYDRSGNQRFYAFAYPDTGLGLIWVDEIAIDGGIEMFRKVATHELLHLSGCWEHHAMPGIMGAFPSVDYINENDTEHCRSPAARYRDDD